MNPNIQEIIDYVDLWRTKNSIKKGVPLSNNEITKLAVDVQNKIAELSFEAPKKGANIIPYSSNVEKTGKFETFQAFRLAKLVSKGDANLCFISDIEAGEILDSKDFRDSLHRAVGDPVIANNLIDGANVKGVRTPYGTNKVLSVNDFVSKNVMLKNAHGNVFTFTGGATVDIDPKAPYKVWAQTEFPILLEMPEVKSIDGIPKEQLLLFKELLMSNEYTEAQALEVLRETISYQCRKNMTMVDIYMGEVFSAAPNGEITIEPKVLGVDTSRLTGNKPIAIPDGAEIKVTLAEAMGALSDAEIRSKYSSIEKFVSNLRESNPELISQTMDALRILEKATGKGVGTDLNTGYPSLSNVAKSLKYLKVRGITLNTLGVVGGALIAMSFVNMVNEADKAYKSGNKEAGNTIVRDWTLETGGGFASSALFAKAFAPYALALGISGGPLGIAGGIALELGAGILGWLAGSTIGRAVSDFIGWLFGEAEGARPPRIDPLILDLDGDGVETISVEKGVYFDLDNNGFSEKSGWVSSDDGLLVMDRDNNGMIDAGKELFGDQTILKDGTIAKNGFHALAEFDGNNDGKIDSSDSQYTNLRVWRDLNQDGQSLERELFGLKELGIESINLKNSSVNTQDSSGNILRNIGEYKKTDGTVGSLAEFLFTRDTSDSVVKKLEEIDVTEEIAVLPEVEGFGNVYSLRQAMARDTGKGLQKLVINFAAEKELSMRATLTEQILFKWTEVSEIDPVSRGENFDARKLAVIEKFMGRDFAGTGGANPIVQAVPFLNQAYNKILEIVYCKLMFQTHLKEILENNYSWDFINDRAIVDLSAIGTIIEKRLDTDFAEGITLLGEFTRVLKTCELIEEVSFMKFRQNFAYKSEECAWAIDSASKNIIKGSGFDDSINGMTGDDAINGMENDDNIAGNAGNDSLYGGEGYDTISGDYGDDVIVGGAGDDKLYGGDGNDLLDGGMGRDYLEGNAGNDTYVFGRDSGQDIICDNDSTAGNTDKILIGDKVTPSELSLSRIESNLVLRIIGTKDTLTVNNYFSGDNYKVEQIEFIDGTVWDTEYVKNAVNTAREQNDYIQGYETNDTLSGLGGNDKIYGKLGDDTIDGGKGNDTLYGEDGDDTVEGGEGNDTVYGGKGKDSLLGGEDDDELYGENEEDVLKGEAGDDKLYGGAGADTMDGGAGNDTMDGGAGDDTYIFGKGYGTDTIGDNDSTEGNTDKITLLEGVHPADVMLKRKDSNLEISIKNTEDKLIVSNYFYSDNYKVEQIEFTDGTVWDKEYIINSVIAATEDNDYLQGYETNDTLSGLGGNDKIYGKLGDDTIDGGKGNDTLYGEDGDDTVEGGEGNDTVYGGKGKDSLLGGEDDDELYGENEEDVLKGEAGDDKLYGGAGADTMDGGAGNDTMDGGAGDDTYIFGKGYGTDTIGDNDSTEGNTDKITLLEGVHPADVMLKRKDSNLEISIKNTEDKLIVSNYFYSDNYKVEQIEFTDGTVWDKEYIINSVIAATEDNDYLQGYETNDTLSGLGGNDKIYGKLGDDTIDGGKGNDTLYGEDGDDTVEGGEGNDTVYGGKGKDSLLGGEDDDELYGENEEDVLKGEAGDDKLYGGAGADTMDGGAGNDTMDGGAGDDTYIFGKGYGTDTIGDNDSTEGNTDKITLLEGVHPADVMLKRKDSNLEISIKNTEDKLIVSNYFYSDNYKVEQIEFTDGTVWDIDFVKKAVLDIKGTDEDDNIQGCDDNESIDGAEGYDIINANAGDDVIYGGANDDTISGGKGNDILYGDEGYDKLYGNEGSDILDGGTGNDFLKGEVGNDTYIFGRGYGQDTIEEWDNTIGNADTVIFKDGILPSEISVSRKDNNLELLINGSTDKITIRNYFSTDIVYKVEQFKFEDGTIWDAKYIEDAVRYITGTALADILTGFNDQNNIMDGQDGNDTVTAGKGTDILNGGAGDDKLYGQDGNDTIDGGAGNDYIEGGVGNDTYNLSKYWGIDTIYEYDTASSNKDVVQFSENALNLIFTKDGSNLNISVCGTNDLLTIKSWYSNTSYQIEEFKEEDGRVLRNTQVEQLIKAMADFLSQNSVTWEQAIKERPEEVKNILSQFWLKQ